MPKIDCEKSLILLTRASTNFKSVKQASGLQAAKSGDVHEKQGRKLEFTFFRVYALATFQ